MNTIVGRKFLLRNVLQVFPFVVKHASMLPAGLGERCFAGIHNQLVGGTICNTVQTSQFLIMFAVHQSQISLEAQPNLRQVNISSILLTKSFTLELIIFKTWIKVLLCQIHNRLLEQPLQPFLIHHESASHCTWLTWMEQSVAVTVSWLYGNF